MIDGRVSLEKFGGTRLNAEETLALGKETLKAAFCSPIASTFEANGMIEEAFELGRQSLRLGIQEQQSN